MATRLYFPSSAAAAAANSPSFDASWEKTSTAIRRPLELVKDQAAYATIADATTGNTPAGAFDVCVGQFISAPLASGVTISGAIRGQIRASENSATADMDMQCVIRVLQSDYSTVRGTLIASDASALGHEFNTALRNISIPKGGSTVPTSVAAQAGDVIVVEIGWRKHENAVTSRTGTFDYGAVSTGTDLPVDETTTTQGVPWIEFTETLTFADVTSRVSFVTGQVAVTPPTVTARSSFVTAQVAVTPPDVTARVSAAYVQVAVSGGVPSAKGFTVSAEIRKIVSSSFTVNAVITKTQPKTFTVNAVVKKTIAPPGFTVDAQTSLPFFHLDAQIAAPLVKIFGDTFTRTTTPKSFLSLWHWIEYDSFSGDVEQVRVYTDGSRLVESNPVGDWYDSYVGFPMPVTGEAYFDFWVPAAWAGNGRPTYGLNFDPLDYVGIYAAAESGGWHLYQLGTDTPYTFTPTASTMYRVHARWDGTTLNANVWKVTDPEPGGWQYSQPQQFVAWSTIGALQQWPPFLDLYYFPENEDGYVDNVEIWTRDATWTGFGGFVAQAEIVLGPHFTVNAVLRKTQAGSFPVRAWIRTSFTVDAWLTRTFFWLDAVIRQRPSASSGAFLLSAHISRSFFHLDAVVGPGGRFTLNAVLKKNQPKTFILDAEVFAGTRLRSFRVNANVRRGTTGSWYTNAELRLPHVEHDVTFTVDAVIREPGVGGSFDVDARIFDGVRTGSFTINADTKGQGEKRGTFTVSAIVRLKISRAFAVNALIGGNGYFRLDAYIRPYFRLDAELVASTILTRAGAFTIDARVFNGREFKVYALIKVKVTRSFGVWAEIFAPGTQGGRYFWLDAFIYTSSGTKTFALDAQVRGGGAFTLDAFVRPYFTIDAFIRSNDVVIWPDDGGPATDPDGNPLPPGFKSARKYQVRITIDGTDITGDVNWSRTSFTQNAKTNPGTFELVLYGPQPYNGGEEILVELDGFRTFGGYVLQIERGYVFESDADWPVTFLRGADFNVLFDKLITYNRASADDPSGKYTPYKAFAKGSLDTRIINKVFGSYVDLPPGFDYKLFVDSVGVAAPEKPWAMPTSGSPLRQVMQSLSQVTDAVWWIDPYLRLHYGSRTQVTAPFPITDGAGGISSRQLSMSEDISQLVTDGFLWGTLAYTVDGEIKVEHQHSSYYASLGPWQYGEFRSDIHHTKYLERRMDSVIERYGKPIKRAQVVIFEPGYQAGQVVDLRLTEHGLEAPLVIRSMVLTFAVGKEPDGTKYYCVPRFELSIGLDPEEPWDIYDYLPFPSYPYDDPGGWTRCNDCEGNCIDDNGGPSGGGGGGGDDGCDEVCGITDSFSREINVAWGTTDAGIDWDTNASGVALSIDGDSAIMNYPGVAVYSASPNATALLPMSSDRVRYAFTVTSDGTPTGGGHSAFTSVIANTYQVMYQHSTGGARTLALHHYAYPTTTSEPVSWTPTIGQKYQLRWEIDAEVEQRVRVWPDGDPEPTSWTIVQDLTGLSNAAGTTSQFHWAFDLYTGIFGSTAGPFGVVLDDLDIDGVNRCSAVQFDDFNRTVSGSFGTSDTGISWSTPTTFGSGSFGVDGSSAYVTGSSFQALGVVSEIVGYEGITNDFTMTARFMTTRIPGSLEASTEFAVDVHGPVDGAQIFVLLATVGSNYLQYRQWTDDGATQIFDSDGIALPFTPTANTWINFKWSTTGGVKIWPDGETEPDWLVAYVLPVFGRDTFRFNPTCTSSATLSIDYIEFDYDGKPCYVDCDDSEAQTWADQGWQWEQGFGVGTETGGGWAIAGNEASLVEPSGSGNDHVNFILNESDNPSVFAKLHAGPFMISGLMTIPYDLAGGSQTPLADNAFQVLFNHSGGFATVASLEAIIGGALDGYVLLYAPSIVNADSHYPGAIGAGSWLWSMTVTTGGVSASIAGYSMAVSGSFNLADVDALRISMGDGSNPPTLAGTWRMSNLTIQFSDGTTWGVACSPVGGGGDCADWEPLEDLSGGAWFHSSNTFSNHGYTDSGGGVILAGLHAAASTSDSDAGTTWIRDVAGDANVTVLQQAGEWSFGYDFTYEANGYTEVDARVGGTLQVIISTVSSSISATIVSQAGQSSGNTTDKIILACNGSDPAEGSHNLTSLLASGNLLISIADDGTTVVSVGDDSWTLHPAGMAPNPEGLTLTAAARNWSIGGGNFDPNGVTSKLTGVTFTPTVSSPGGTPWCPDVSTGDGDPSAPGGPCHDPDGETFGAVTQGWGCETLKVVAGFVELTGQAAQGTLTVYDADTGDFIDVGDFDVNDGKTFVLPGNHARVMACYRNYTPEIGSNPSVPRLPNASVGRRYE